MLVKTTCNLTRSEWMNDGDERVQNVEEGKMFEMDSLEGLQDI